MRNLQIPTRMAALLCLVFIFHSCSKDADLLSEYVITKNDNATNLQTYVVNDVFYIDSNTHIVLDVLNNDNFEELSHVSITNTSTAQNGTIVINSDNTLTYTPKEEVTTTEEFEDTFTYTAEEVDEEGTVTEEEATVTVSNNEAIVYADKNLSPELSRWKTIFDEQFAKRDKQELIKLASSGNKFQEYYYMSYYLDGLLSIWQATGDNDYLDSIIDIINLTIEDASPVNFNNNYLGWKSDSSYSLDYPKNGVALWESYYWKVVTTLLRVIHQSPSLLDNTEYNNQYQNILNFTEIHIWEKWETKGLGNLYRSHTHMASHWARMGMELYLITGKEKYKNVFENISFGQIPNYPSNLRELIHQNPKTNSAIIWNQTWSGNKIQDTSHASDLVSFWILAFENEMYWNQGDINGLVNTLDQVIFLDHDGANYKLNVDGSGGYDVPGRLRDWIKLGRFNRELQNRLVSQYYGDPSNASRYPIHHIGNYALNEKILTDGKPVYPEN